MEYLNDIKQNLLKYNKENSCYYIYTSKDIFCDQLEYWDEEDGSVGNLKSKAFSIDINRYVLS